MPGGDLYAVEIEPEVREWLTGLTSTHYTRVEAHVDNLAENAETLSEPYSRHLQGKVRELRFALDGSQVRIAYWLAPGRRVILLTVFKKTQRREPAEIARAVATQKVCEAEHEEAQHTWTR